MGAAEPVRAPGAHLPAAGEASERGGAFPAGGLHVRLVTASPPPGTEFVDLVDPFVSLHDRAALSRALLAEVVGPDGKTVLPFVLKLQSDEYPLLADGPSSTWTNVAIEEAWEREVELLEQWGRAGGGALRIVEILPRPAATPARIPPTLYCKRRRTFFAAPCPSCGEPLRDVRDNRLLEDRGLPRFDRSVARFLGCPACLARGATQLWTLVNDRETTAKEVGDQADLVRALGPLARTRPPADEEPAFTCQRCDHTPTCHPEAGTARGDALRVLTPVTFYDSYCIGLEPLHLRFDEFAALVGGASFDAIAAGVTEPGRLALLRQLEPRFTERPQYFFAHDPAGKLGLEVLRLKLTLFRELCAATAALHRYTRGPHLGLSPARVMIRSEPSGMLPNLWTFAVGLIGLGNARPKSLGEGAALVYERPRLIDPVYAAEPLREFPASDQPCTVTVRAVQRAAEGRTTVELDVATDSIDLAPLGDKDRVELALVQGRPPLSLRLVAQRTGAAAQLARLRTLPAVLDAGTTAALEQMVDRPFGRARLTVWPSLHVPCDVHALGMMLFTALTAGPAASPPAIARRVEEPRRELATHAAPGHLLRRAAEDGPLRKTHLFADPDRHARAAAAVPDALWLEALQIALRAASTVRGFSVCRGHSDFDPGHPEVKTEFLLQLVDTLIRQVDAELFGLPGRAREIAEALARVERDLLPVRKAE